MDGRWSGILGGGKVAWFGRLVCGEESVRNSSLCCKLERDIEGQACEEMRKWGEERVKIQRAEE